MGDDLSAHARVPEARQMLGDDRDGIFGIRHLVGRDVVNHFHQTFDIHNRLASVAVDDAFGMTVDDQVRPTDKGREGDLTELREAHRARSRG